MGGASRAGVQPVTEEVPFLAWAASRQHALLRTAYLLSGGDLPRAENLVRDALTTVAGRWRQVGGDAPEAYAHRILVRDSVSRWRRSRDPVGAGTSEGWPPDSADPAEGGLQVIDVLQQLTPKQRAMLVLSTHGGQTAAETAELLGVGVGTVRAQTADGLQRLGDLAPRLAELLDEAADSVPTPDLAPGARRAALHRRRRRLAVAGGLAAAVAATVALAPGDDDSQADPSRASTEAAASRPVQPDLTLGGRPVWVGPTAVQEAGLDPIPGSLARPLPSTIDLAQPAVPIAEAPLHRALAAFARVDERDELSEVLLLAPDGSLRSVEAAGFDPVTGAAGHRRSPFGPGSLSPDGSRLALGQDGAVHVLTLSTGVWTRHPVADRPTHALTWLARSTGVVLGDEVLRVPGGGMVSVAMIPVRLEITPFPVTAWAGVTRAWGGQLARPAYIWGGRGPPDVRSPVLVVGGDRPTLLVLPDPAGQRWRRCCAAVGWLDVHTAAYESQGSAPDGSQFWRVLAWDTETGQVSRLSEIVGTDADLSGSASWADLTG